jgi:hypothetical protein
MHWAAMQCQRAVLVCAAVDERAQEPICDFEYISHRRGAGLGNPRGTAHLDQRLHSIVHYRSDHLERTLCAACHDQAKASKLCGGNIRIADRIRRSTLGTRVTEITSEELGSSRNELLDGGFLKPTSPSPRIYPHGHERQQHSDQQPGKVAAAEILIEPIILPAHQRHHVAHCNLHPFSHAPVPLQLLRTWKAIFGPSPVVGSHPTLPQAALSENPKQVAQQQNQEHCSKTDACSSSAPPSAIAVVASTSAKYDYQNNNQNN